MPRVSRQISKSSIYHIVLRGINRQNIFEDSEDNNKFIQALEKYKDLCNYEIYAYCLMGNHVHFLIKEGLEPLGQIMRRICGSYVYWFNHKYDRVGNLFQDRFKSEPVEDDAYLLTVIRYIFQNPLKAGITSNIEEYRWTNYKEYIYKNKNTSIDFVLNILSNDRKKAIEYFKEHINLKSEDLCLEVTDNKIMKDDKAKQIINNECKINNPIDIQKLNKDERNYYLNIFKKKHGLSVRQIERLTGINRGVILKA